MIGDGLASAIYNFPNLDEKGTRIIIFSTDNDLSGDEIITLSEAAELAKKKKIIVYAIAPKNITDENRSALKKAAELTGGAYYEGTSSSTINQIVGKIEKTEKNNLRTDVKIIKKDQPNEAFIALIISIIILFVLNRKVDI